MLEHLHSWWLNAWTAWTFKRLKKWMFKHLIFWTLDGWSFKFWIKLKGNFVYIYLNIQMSKEMNVWTFDFLNAWWLTAWIFEHFKGMNAWTFETLMVWTLQGLNTFYKKEALQLAIYVKVGQKPDHQCKFWKSARFCCPFFGCKRFPKSCGPGYSRCGANE